MLASAAFFAVKAMARPPAETNSVTAPRVPSGPAVDHGAPDATRAHGSNPSTWQRVLAVVSHSAGGVLGSAGRGRRRVGRAARAD
jgi:hypothetical protein